MEIKSREGENIQVENNIMKSIPLITVSKKENTIESKFRMAPKIQEMKIYYIILYQNPQLLLNKLEIQNSEI